MTADPENPGWFKDVPDSKGEYLVICSTYWLPYIGTWIPGEGKRPGRWYLSGKPYCTGDGIALWRPLPKIPARPAKIAPIQGAL
jgi:hypothetical protein